MYGLGIDIVEVERIDERISRRILGENEKQIYEQIINNEARRRFLAGRFAVKEALAKALSIRTFDFRSAEFLRSEDGAPVPSETTIDIAGNREVRASISHEKKYVVAVVLVI
ncbi:MAG TPA: holo-[acyl-carrier-protein] synthase [Kosmotogaceae bacterium]|nr:MAG: Holo-[acyl-carrier-protein] synthase [Thermotogales bacterium 46_20]HAA85089.1 holo-[acyl-carrier-protein] synthase [Kosmotogaceae bacterium]